MNDFLEKHGYFLEKKDHQVIIHHKPDSYGCIHILFVMFLIPCIVMTFFFNLAFAIVLVPLTFFYFMEVDKRKKHANSTVFDFDREQILINKSKKKTATFPFVDATSVVTTSDHIGGYASSDRNTTEEYRREINVIFGSGEVLTAFSFVSDYEEAEEEVGHLVRWLEKLLSIKVS